MKDSICIDFDGTIAEVDSDYNPVKLKAGAREAINTLKDKFEIIIFSARNWSGWKERYNDLEIEKRISQMVNFLDENKVYYDKISKTEDGKYIAKYYIDDRAIEFKDNWEQITTRMISENKPGLFDNKLKRIAKRLINE